MKTNDYGSGFYCTEEIELAKEWACKKQKNGFVNKYELDLSELNVMNLNAPPYNILNWLAILADNRTYWQNGSIAEEYYMKKVLRERDARRKYRRELKRTANVNELFILDIMREEMGNGDTRIF